MFYAALDVSLRSIAVCIIDHEGKVRLERSIPSEVPDLIRCLREFGEPIHQVGLETGTLTQHLTYGLGEAGFEVICMEARQVNAALSAMRNKTDRHDARGIAQILRSGWYSRVHVKSLQSHYTRALLTSRKAIQRRCIDLENEIRGILKVFEAKLPMRLSRGGFDRAVRDTIEADPALSHALLPMLQARQVLFDTFIELDRRVRRAAQDDAVCRRFMGVPGVGEITALSFRAAVDDPAHVKSSRTVGAHFGLTPRRFQSGEKDNPGRISHAGDADVRATPYAAANAMLMRSITWSSLKAWGVRLMKTKGRRRAIVAVARKIAVVLHRMWVDGSDFLLGSEAAASADLHLPNRSRPDRPTRTTGWMKPKMSAALSSASKSEALQTLIPCMRAASADRGHPDCEEKPDPRERSTADELTELAPHARLEKRTFTPARKGDFGRRVPSPLSTTRGPHTPRVAPERLGGLHNNLPRHGGDRSFDLRI